MKERLCLEWTFYFLSHLCPFGLLALYCFCSPCHPTLCSTCWPYPPTFILACCLALVALLPYAHWLCHPELCPAGLPSLPPVVHSPCWPWCSGPGALHCKIGACYLESMQTGLERRPSAASCYLTHDQARHVLPAVGGRWWNLAGYGRVCEVKAGRDGCGFALDAGVADCNARLETRFYSGGSNSTRTK